MKQEEQKEKRQTLKERLKDKRERAKIELMLYGIFFIAVVIFARIMGSGTNNIENSNNEEFTSFITAIEDNYEYDIQIVMDDKKYEYYGKVLGNNSTINLKEEDKLYSYRLMNKKYYILEEDNYILTDEEEVYPYIDNRYLNINTIKEYISISTKENNTYKVKISDLILNSDSTDYLALTIDEGDKSLVVDYTPLFKITEETTEKVVVSITYNNINNIISLEE